MNKEEAILLLKSLIETLESLDEYEFQDLLNGVKRKYTRDTPKRLFAKKESKLKTTIPRLTIEDMKAITGKLQACTVRGEAREILEKDLRLNARNNLNDLARFLKIHVTKNDKREQIQDKIIEYVVGTKLRSEAILGLRLKGQ